MKSLKQKHNDLFLSIPIQVSNPRKVGDGMSSYVVYTVTSKTNMTLFKRPGMQVYGIRIGIVISMLKC